MMVGIGEFVHSTEQRREMLRQLKEHMDNEWLKRKAAGTLSKKKIILPGAEPIDTIIKKKKAIQKKKKKKKKSKTV